MEEIVARSREKERRDDPRFLGMALLVHPAWVAGAATHALYHQFTTSAGIHVTSQDPESRSAGMRVG